MLRMQFTSKFFFCYIKACKTFRLVLITVERLPRKIYVFLTGERNSLTLSKSKINFYCLLLERILSQLNLVKLLQHIPLRPISMLFLHVSLGNERVGLDHNNSDQYTGGTLQESRQEDRLF
jgi:hypothetical protein